MALDGSDPALDWKPATPAWRTARMQALSGLFRTPTRLTTPTMAVSRGNKRGRARTSSLSTPCTPSMSPSANTPTLPAVVLQTYSLSTDSIVLTALPSVPFCCHEDLLTMSRTELEGVVRALNERLPRRMRIGPEDDFWQGGDQSDRNGCGADDEEDDGLSRMSEAEIKKRIEELVGIRAIVGKNRVPRSGLGLGLGLGTRIRGVPPAPKAVRIRDPTWRPYEKSPWDMDADGDENQADDLGITTEDAFMGSSPLASRTKFSLHPRGRINPLSRLASLEEESEGSESTEDSEETEMRPSKRQRVLPGSAIQHREEVQEARESRLIEDMDISGSPWTTRDGEALLDSAIGSDAMAIPTTTNQDRDGSTKTTKKGVQAAFQRRRSARIKEIALKRASSVDGMKTTIGAQLGLKSSILRSKTFSAKHSSWNNSSLAGRSDAGKDLSTPRELVIRLPFTSTPPQQKPNSSSWSAPRVLRSHSQRLLQPSRSMKNNASLGRSLSERYPRASDLAFVTINRPRYRFTRRKSKGSRVTEGEESDPPKSATPVQAACQPQQEVRIYTSDVSGKREHKKENNDPRVVTRYIGIGGLHTLPSALCSFLTPRARALSTSSIASTSWNQGDSPARMVDRARECDASASATTRESVVRDGTTVRVSEALERMAVDSLIECLSKRESKE